MNDLLNNLPTEIICALITAGGAILSAVIAHLTARGTTRREIKKLKMQWKRDDDLAAQKTFSEMYAAVSKYIQSGWSRHQRDAMEKVSELRANEQGELLNALDDLHAAILSEMPDVAAQQLTVVLQLRKRRPKGKK